MKIIYLIEAIAKLLRPIKSPFWRHFSPRFLACPFGHGLVCAARASLLALRTGVKIIDCLRHSSFATASSLLLFCSGLCAETIQGFWKSIDEKTGNPRCLVAIYEYQDKYYGRIVGTYNKEGVMDETIDDPQDRAPGVIGEPYYCGLDLIWDLKKGSHCKGKIVDPEKGNIYRAELWVEDGNLIVRGKLLCFGRNQTWIPASQDDFPPSFKQPDVTEFVPVIPEVD